MDNKALKAHGVLWFFLGSALALGVSACSPAKPKLAVDLSGYTAWERTTSSPLDFPIPGHENNHRRIYMNKIGMDYRRTASADPAQAMDYPEGAIVVKEIYSGLGEPGPNAVPKSLDIMVKDTKNKDNRGSWVWIVRDTASGSDMVFKGDFCANCHNGANEKHPYGDRNLSGTFRDFLFY